jgi:Ala-tRNA(Pro) deacylase
MNTLAHLKEFLDRNGASYRVILHEEVHTAQNLAEILHTPGDQLVKVVLVRTDSTYRMLVLPATRRIDLQSLAKALNAATVTLATEQELATLLPDAEPGSLPPFGNLYGLEVWMDPSLAKNQTITFSAGTSYEAVRMSYRDLERLTRPRVAAFSVHL